MLSFELAGHDVKTAAQMEGCFMGSVANGLAYEWTDEGRGRGPAGWIDAPQSSTRAAVTLSAAGDAGDELDQGELPETLERAMRSALTIVALMPILLAFDLALWISAPERRLALSTVLAGLAVEKLVVGRCGRCGPRLAGFKLQGGRSARPSIRC